VPVARAKRPARTALPRPPQSSVLRVGNRELSSLNTPPSAAAAAAAAARGVSISGGTMGASAGGGKAAPALFNGLRVRMGVATGLLPVGQQAKGSVVMDLAKSELRAWNGVFVFKRSAGFVVCSWRGPGLGVHAPGVWGRPGQARRAAGTGRDRAVWRRAAEGGVARAGMARWGCKGVTRAAPMSGCARAAGPPQWCPTRPAEGRS
jgi:hypothetical protein